VLFTLALLVPQASLAQEWWQGNWTANPAWCAQVDNIGAVTPAPIAITQDNVSGYENTCAITRATALDAV